MTPHQYHYPFFLDLDALQAVLRPLQWTARIEESGDKNQSGFLAIEKMEAVEPSSEKEITIKIGFHETLMILDSILYCWKKYDDGLFVRQFQLTDEDPTATMLSEFIEILSLDPGRHMHPTRLTYDHFVTFIRKGNLERKEDYYEQYVILHLHQQTIAIIPFDSFNETGGDPLYMWPALATLDLEKGKLHGLGMRMGSFTTQL